jgi:hypothetical protein
MSFPESALRRAVAAARQNQQLPRIITRGCLAARTRHIPKHPPEKGRRRGLFFPLFAPLTRLVF